VQEKRDVGGSKYNIASKLEKRKVEETVHQFLMRFGWYSLWNPKWWRDMLKVEGKASEQGKPPQHIGTI
jgi:hypothetical protein